jgi:menaquinone-dependent protoporphyrinogen oxidase
MCEVPVFFATTEGQTYRIAERIACHMREHGLTSEAISVTSEAARRFRWDRARGAVLGASLHRGRHQTAAASFAAAHRDDLNARRSGFFSVSLSAGSKRADEVQAARRLAEAFVRDAGWRPHAIRCFAGRLAYPRYGFVTRMIMRAIAKREGGATDTSREHEYTDWAEVARFSDEIASAIRRPEVFAVQQSV